MARRQKDPTRHMHGEHQAAKSQNPSRIGKSRLGRSLRPAYHAAPPPATRPALGPRGVRHGLTSADPVLSTHARARGWELRLVELGGRVGSMWPPESLLGASVSCAHLAQLRGWKVVRGRAELVAQSYRTATAGALTALWSWEAGRGRPGGPESLLGFRSSCAHLTQPHACEVV